MKPSLLIVEDDPSLVELLRYNLAAADFDVDVATDGEEGLLKLQENDFDLAILDWMLPNLSGLEICRQIRRDSDLRHLPVLMLTARGEESDKVRGLETGADDYMVKPFSPAELIARVKALLRRAGGSVEDETLTYEDLTMDLVRHRVTRAGKAVHLGPTEFRLLKVLMEKPGRVFSREQLLDKAWGRDIYVEPRTVDVHVRRLRKALNATKGFDLIRTVRAAGYALEKEEL